MSDLGRPATLPKGRAPAAPAALAMLRLGASGESVKELQRQLNELGESLLVSGQFGPRTVEAVRRFQVAKGLQPADGMVSANTQKALDELKKAGNPRVIPRAPRVADWFQSGAQKVVDGNEAEPDSVQLKLIDGRSLTCEQALDVMTGAYMRARGGATPDPDDERDLVVSQVNREWEKLTRKGWLTAGERKQVAQLIKTAFERLGETEVIAITGTERKAAVQVIEYS